MKYLNLMLYSIIWGWLIASVLVYYYLYKQSDSKVNHFFPDTSYVDVLILTDLLRSYCVFNEFFCKCWSTPGFIPRLFSSYNLFLSVFLLHIWLLFTVFSPPSLTFVQSEHSPTGSWLTLCPSVLGSTITS